jgi:nicotinamide-nucleotide amidase
MDDDLYHIATEFGNALFQRGLTVSTAESCTGGGIAYALTEIPGSSAWFTYGWVTYSNQSKQDLLGIPGKLIEQYGAVSEPVVKAMAEGALLRSRTDFSIAVTGIAGPSGGTTEKPVGTIWLAWSSKSQPTVTERLSLLGNRFEIRQQTIFYAIKKCHQLVEKF